eukprot:14669291-Alexandrium_andersonii.AAC.1
MTHERQSTTGKAERSRNTSGGGGLAQRSERARCVCPMPASRVPSWGSSSSSAASSNPILKVS